MRKRLRQVLVLAVAGLAVFVTAQPAQAADRATHYATHVLSADPNSGMADLCMPAKRIYIAAGTYDWGMFFGGQELDLRPGIELAAGWYWWGNCLYPQDGYWDYQLGSSLDPEAPGLDTAHASGYVEMGPPDRAATWGTYLNS